MENTAFKNVSEYIEHLEGQEVETLNKEEVIEALKTIPTRKGSGQRRGQLAGLTLDQMTDEQLKREIINANSVLYKAKQRGAAQETIERNQARVDAALAEKAKRTGETEATEEVAEDEVYIESDTADEL